MDIGAKTGTAVKWHGCLVYQGNDGCIVASRNKKDFISTSDYSPFLKQ